MSDLPIGSGQTLLFIGDSITDTGRRGSEAPLGNGYTRFFAELVTAGWPERQISYINKGIGGNRITDLQNRWQDDVLFHRPDYLSIKIGINDLHSHLRGAEDGVSPQLFAEIYDQLLDQTKSELDCPIVLLSPFYISLAHEAENQRGKVLEIIPHYIETVENMAAKYQTKLVLLHDLFQEHLRYRDADTFCPEPVHPNRTGHLLIAQALLDVLTE